MTSPDEVLSFWFPPGIDRADEKTFMAQLGRWFQGGTFDEIRARFADVTERAARGELEPWAATPRGRLALLIVLDQFSRGLWTDTPRSFAQDEKSQNLVLDGIVAGAHLGLSPAEQLFVGVALSHSESLGLQDLAVALAEHVLTLAPAPLRKFFELSVSQANAHRDVIRRFGRHPHRNAILGRTSTPAELAYLANEIPPHKRVPKI